MSALLVAACGGGSTAPPAPLGGDAEAAGSDAGVPSSDRESGAPLTDATDERPGAPDCSGSFGSGDVLFAEPSSHSLDNLTLPEDELELFYAAKDSTTRVRGLVVRKRSSKLAPFSEATPVAELSSLCPEGATYDVSNDGLRMYVACADATTGAPGPLQLAVRANRQAPFVVSAKTYGAVASSFALTADELVGYASEANPLAGHVLVYHRSTVDDAFAGGTEVPNLQAPFYSPEPTPDGLGLLGGYALTRTTAQIVVANRPSPSQDFAPATATGMPMTGMTDLDGSPALSTDCRTLYWVHVARVDGGLSWSVLVAHR